MPRPRQGASGKAAGRKPKAALTPLQVGLKLVARRARTERELDQALTRAKIEKEARVEVLARLRELGYMDDREVARGRARTLLSRGEAPRKATRRLLNQGVAAEDARGAVDEAAEGASEAELVARALEKRLRGRAPRDDRERQRVFRALIAKGHRPAAVAQALKLQLEGEDLSADDEAHEA